MPPIPATDFRTTLWKELEKFLKDRGCAPQPSGVWPVNYADAVDFAIHCVNKNKKHPLKDRSVAILQVVRALRNTCPGCGQSSEDQQTAFRDPSDIIVRIGEFRWHQTCVNKPVNGAAPIPPPLSSSGSIKDLKDTIEEQDQDLRRLVEAVLEVEMKSTQGYRLQVLASEISDKYTTWRED